MSSLSTNILRQTVSFLKPTTFGNQSIRKETTLTLAVILGAAYLLAMLAKPLLAWWRWEYIRPDSYYAFAPFVPLLSGLMLWTHRTTLRQIVLSPDNIALVLLLPALALLMIAEKTQMQSVMSLAFLLSLTGSLWFLLGRNWVRAALFPLGFLFLMAPLPGPVLNDVTAGLQQLSTVGAASLLKLLTFHAIRDGNQILMDGFTYTIDVPCSGFKLLLTLLTFSGAFAYLTDAMRSRKWLLFALSLPLAIGINTARIALIGIVGVCFGATTAEHFHDTGGLLSLVVCMTCLFGLAKVLGCQKFAGQQLF